MYQYTSQAIKYKNLAGISPNILDTQKNAKLMFI